ncbi:MAG: sigma-70 family RNA polymerase sigma factor [Oscillibacter sp.]|nr:sigma-70 family RNA polymerase sigma factor [Oscillibacter sp.]
MESNPRDCGERCRFDAFCKTVLKHEAIDYIREMKQRASRETSLERLPQATMDKLRSADDYPSDSYVFSYCGYDLPIRSQQGANAFADLPEQEQSILILRLVLNLTDSESGEALGLSRSAVQRRRTKSLNVLRAKLTARRGG